MHFIPYGRQDIGGEDIQGVIDVLQSEYLTQGPAVGHFEEAFCSYIGSAFSIAVSNGTAGLHLAYLAAEIGPGDAVFVPAITFAATANAVLYCGATPIFVDIDKNTQCMSLSSLEEAIALAIQNGLSPKIISLVYYAGRPSDDICGFGTLAKKHGMIIIEDACHALGAEFRQKESEEFKKIGNSDIAVMTVFSFHPVKHITTGEGGMITTNHENYANRLRMIRTHGITKSPELFVNKERALDKKTGLVNTWYHEMQFLGLNYRITDLQSVLGHTQLKRLPSFLKRRREVAHYYANEFKKNSLIQIPAGDSALVRHAYHLYPIQINFEKINLTRNELFLHLKENNIGVQVHYIPVCWHPFYANNPHLWKSVALPESESYYSKTLSIPMFSSLSATDCEKVTQCINEAVR